MGKQVYEGNIGTKVNVKKSTPLKTKVYPINTIIYPKFIPMEPVFTRNSTTTTGKGKYSAMMLKQDTTEFYTTTMTKKTSREGRYRNI